MALNRTALLSLTLCISHSLTCTDKQEKDRKHSAEIETITQIVPLFFELIIELDQQPIVAAKDDHAPTKSKTLEVATFELAGACEIVNNATKDMLSELSEKSLRIVCSNRYTKPQSPPTLQLFVSKQPSDFELVGQAYYSIMSNISQKWSFAHLKDHQNIFYKKDPQDWYLLVRQKSFHRQDALIRYIAALLKLDNAICCSDLQLQKSSNYQPSTTLYWWIKKDSFPKVAMAFELPKKLQSHE